MELDQVDCFGALGRAAFAIRFLGLSEVHTDRMARANRSSARVSLSARLRRTGSLRPLGLPL